jgi:hypothetical protein
MAGIPRVYTYAVTLESDHLPPRTIRGEIKASRETTVVSKATKEALSRSPRFRWTSLVILLEKGADLAPKGDPKDEH